MDHRQPLPAAEASIEYRGPLAWLGLPSARGLDESGLRQSAELFDQLAEDGQVEAIGIRGSTRVFLSGADLPFFVRSIVSGDIERVLRFTRNAHEWLARIECCAKPVVAWVQGAAFGAGLELALACEAIVASAGAKFSLPETTLGIYPGMGGTQRLPRRIGGGLAKWMIYTGAIVPAAQALEMGLIAAVATEPTSLDELLATARCGARPRIEAHRRLGQLQQFFNKHSVAQLLDTQMPQPSEPELIRALIQLRNNGPIALRLAEGLIDQALTLSLEEGLHRELSDLRQVFATEDALNGLLTFGKSRATFVGA